MRFSALVTAGALALSAVAYADMTPAAPGEARGRIHRLSLELAQQAELAAIQAKQIYGDGFYNGALREEEAQAVAALVFVKDTALEFRMALEQEGLRGPVQGRTQTAYNWLNRAYTSVETNTVLLSEYRLRGPGGPLPRMENTMAQLRNFYNLAARLGWSLAEVVWLSEKLERETVEVVRQARLELVDRREMYIVRQLEEFERETRFFRQAALRYGSPVDARVVLGPNFRNLQSRYYNVSNLMNNPRFDRFSPVVKAKFQEVRMAFADLEYAFLSAN